MLKQILGLNKKSKELSIEGKILDYNNEVDGILNDKNYFFKYKPENILTKILSERFVQIKRISLEEEVKTKKEINENQNQINKKETKIHEKNDDDKNSEESEENEKNEESEESEESERK